MLDRDISAKTWNNYLKKYSDVYRLKRMEDGIWAILCKWGEITLHSYVNKQLGFYGNFKTSQKKTYFLKKLPKTVEIIQNYECEVNIAFLESYLPFLLDIFQVRKKKVLTEQHKAKLRKNLSKINNKG